jgi:hypothetical protein
MAARWPHFLPTQQLPEAIEQWHAVRAIIDRVLAALENARRDLVRWSLSLPRGKVIV